MIPFHNKDKNVYFVFRIARDLKIVTFDHSVNQNKHP